MLSKIIASIVFLIPLFVVIPVAYMGFASYKGLPALIYAVGGLGILGLCIIIIANILRESMNPWSIVTWIVAAADVLLLVATLVPRKPL
jgi:hypothetical protein